MINIIILLVSIQFQFYLVTSQQCSFPNQRCVCSTTNPYCPCSIITGNALLNTSSNYNSHLILVSGQGCKPCGPACRKCSNAPSICVDCFQSFYLTNSTCEACPINCRTCSGKVCLQCVYGYYLDYRKNCQACPLQGSKECSLTQIKSCWNNYWLDNNGALCVNCDINCAKCESMTRCQICNTGFYTNGGKCYKCRSDCLTCDNQNSCLDCLKPNYYFNSNKSSCEVIAIQNCQVSNRNNTCKSCQTHYALIIGSNNQTCKSIVLLGAVEIPYCSIHQYDQTLSNLICSSCQYGFYKSINKNDCRYGCSHMCISCRGPHYGLCNSCSDGAKLENLHCLPNYNLQNGAVYQIMYTAQTNPGKFIGATTIFFGSCFQEVFAGGSTLINIKLDKLNSYKVILKWKTYLYGQKAALNLSYKILWNPSFSNFTKNIQPEFCPNSSYINSITPSCKYNYCINKQTLQIQTDIIQNNTISFQTEQTGAFLGISEFIVIGYRCGGVTGSSCALCSDISTCTKCYDSSYYISGQLCLSECPSIKYTYEDNKTCYTNCPSKTYSEQSSRQCYDCHSPCITCESINFCLSCQAGYFLFSSSGECLLTCPDKYFGDSYKGTCDPCVFPCLDCESSAKCTSCMYGFLDIETQSCATQCPAKYYGDIQKGTCMLCKEPCNTCFNTQNNCQTCIQGYLYLNYQCLTQCPQGYYAINQTCQLCHQYCASCSITSKNCTKCSSGYLLDYQCYYQCPLGTFKNIIQMNCQACSIECQTCSQLPSKCLSCSSNYYYIIQEMKCISNCLQGTYAANGKCISCPLPCFTCTNISTCISCLDMFEYKGSCISQCPLGTYAEINSLRCQECNLSACNQCSNSPNYCTKCLTSQILFNNTCITLCPQKYYKSSVLSLQCLPCAKPCNLCLSQQECLSCVDPYIHFGLECILQCPFGMFFSNNTCLACQISCLSCYNKSSNCSQCSTGYNLFRQNYSCLITCPDGYYSYDRECYRCLPPCQNCQFQYFCSACLVQFGSLLSGSCLTNCPQTYFYNNISNACQKCSSNCSTCYRTMRNCSSCFSPYFLQYVTQQSINYSRSCITACPPGQYSQKLNNRCLICSSACLTCSNLNDNCTSCLSSYIFLNGKCLRKCSQLYYYYIDTKGNAYCKQCPVNCQSCYNDTYCTSCKSGSSFTQNNECVLKCPDGYYSASGICFKCQYPCENCISQLQCLTCRRGYLRQHQCIFSCPIGTYLSFNTSQCINCQNGCLDCKNSTYCQICDVGYLYQGKCLNNCPKGYFSQFSICSACPQGCSQCTNSSNCLYCSEGFSYLGGCVQQCSYGWVATTSNITKLCKLCQPPCLTCIQTVDQCISCVSGTLLYLNKCQNICPAGTYTNYQLQHCSSCKLPCQTCKNAYSCETCIYGYILYQQDQKNQCVQGPYCPNSYYLDIDDKVCKFTCQNKFIEPIFRTCSKVCPDQYVHLISNLSCLVRCPDNMWINQKYQCRPIQQLNGTSLPFFSCSQTEVRNLLIFYCSVTVSLSNLQIINKKNFTTSVGVIEDYFYRDDRSFYLVIAETNENHLYLKWATISVTYRYGLKSLVHSSNTSRLLQQQIEQTSTPLQNINVQAFIYNFHSYTYLQREIGLHMLEISQSITIGVLILWFLALLKNASPVSLLLIIGTQYLYSISLIQANFAPNFNQFLEGFKISQFYFLGISSQNFDFPLWSISNANRIQLQSLVDIGNFTQTLVPCIFIFLIFLVFFLVTLSLSRLLPKATQNEMLIDIAIKADIINCRFNHNYWHQCALLLTSPISLFFFAQILKGYLIGILIGAFFMLAILLFTLRVFYRMNYVTRAQRPSKQFFCFMVFEIIILNALAIWASIYIFAGASIALFIMNLFFWQKLFSTRWMWKSIHCQIFDVARILLMILTCIGEFKLVNLDSSTLYLYGWIEIAVVFIIVISVAVLQTRQFFGISNILIIAGLGGINENLIKNGVGNSEQNEEDQIDNRSFFVQQQAVEYSDSQQEDIIDFDDINTNLGFQKPASTLIRYDRNAANFNRSDSQD